jgi:hypothetical protein
MKHSYLIVVLFIIYSCSSHQTNSEKQVTSDSIQVTGQNISGTESDSIKGTANEPQSISLSNLDTMINVDFKEQTDKYFIVISSIHVDSVNFPYYFTCQKQIDSILEIHIDYYSRGFAIEKYMIKDCSVPVRIKNKSRIVSLQNGKEVILTPQYEEQNYTYESEFRNLDLLHFKVLGEQMYNYFLLDSKTGEKTYTVGRVFINRAKTFVISINDDIDIGDSFNGFQLFKINQEGDLKEIWRYSPSWAPEKIKWIDNSTLLVQGYLSDMSPEKTYKKIRIYKRIK